MRLRMGGTQYGSVHTENGGEGMKKPFMDWILLVLRGILVGFGAIMPGISGGTLCVAFGMYQPLMNLLAHPFKALRKDGLRLAFFVLGVGIGFVGLAGVADWLMAKDSDGITCAFIGLILGTLPGLWMEAGEKGRGRSSYLWMLGGFVALGGVLLALRQGGGVTIAPDFWGFLLCGIFWGLSFVVPGLGSSTLLIFFGLYQPMLEGIAHLSLSVLIPLAIGMGLCLLTLPKAVNHALEKKPSQISHAIIGITAASVLAVVPSGVFQSPGRALIALLYMAAGFVLAFTADRICARLAKANE